VFYGSAVLLAALPVAAATAVFSALNAIVLTAVPFPHPEELFEIQCTHPTGPAGTCSVPVAVSIWKQARLIDELAYYSFGGARLSRDNDEPYIVTTRQVSSSYFSTLGIKPAAGRWFFAADNDAADNLIILSEKTRRRLFQEGEDPIGQTIRVGTVWHVVVGTMPEAFTHPDSRVGAWILDKLTFARMAAEGLHDTFIVVRMVEGTSAEEVNAELALIAARLREQLGPRAPAGLTVRPLRDAILGDDVRIVYVLFGGTLCLLVAVVANLVNLFGVQSSQARDDQLVRASLGATRFQLRYEHFVFHFGLAVPVAGVAIALAAGVLAAIQSTGGLNLSRAELAGMTAPVYAYCIGLTMVILGTASSVGFAGLERSKSLRARTIGITSSPRVRVIQRVSVVVQLAVIMVLVLGSISAYRLLTHIRNLSIGFDAQDLVAVNFDRTDGDERTARASRVFFDWLVEDLEATGRVEGVATATSAPLTGGTTAALPIEDTHGGWQESGRLRIQRVSKNYFQVLRIPIVAGRPFGRGDDEGAQCVAIVNRALSLQLGGPSLALGRVVSANGATDARAKRCVVVGVAENARDWSVQEEAKAQIYFAYRQHGDRSRTVLIRTRAGLGIGTTVRSRVKGNSYGQTIQSIAGVWAFVSAATRRERLLSYHVLLFGLCGFAAAALGLIALASYCAAARRTEIGIRRAMGAPALPTLLRVVRDNAGLGAVGVFGGVIAYRWVVQQYAPAMAPLESVAGLTMTTAAIGTYLVFLAGLAWPVGRIQKAELTMLLRVT
jgi:putative ABC transport system permease protein